MNYKLLITLLLVYPLVSETSLLAAQVTAEILPTIPVTLLAEKTDSAPPSRGAPVGRRGAGVPFMELPSRETPSWQGLWIEPSPLTNTSSNYWYDIDDTCYYYMHKEPTAREEKLLAMNACYQSALDSYRGGQLQEALKAFGTAFATAQYERDKATILDTIDLISSHLNISLAVSRESSDHKGEVIILNYLGLVYDKLGKQVKALESFNQALIISRKNDDYYGETYSLNNIAALYFSQGDKPKALEYLDQALALIQAIGDRSGEGITLNNIGEVYHSLGESAKAREYYQQALTIFQELGDTQRAETVQNTVVQLDTTSPSYRPPANQLLPSDGSRGAGQR